MNIASRGSVWPLVLLLLSGFSGEVRAGIIVFDIDTTVSSLTFNATLIAPSGGGFVSLPVIVDPGTVGDNLTTRLSGSFTADPVLNSLGSGAPILQLDNLQGSVFDSLNNRVGQLGVSNLPASRFQFALATSPSRFVIQQGVIAYSVNSLHPPLASNGSLSVAGGVLAAGAPTFTSLSNGRMAVDYTVSFSGLLPTGDPTVFLNTQIISSVHGVSAIPEPSSLLPLLGCATFYLSFRRRSGLVSSLLQATVTKCI